MFGWDDIAAKALGLIDFWSKWFGKKDDQNTGRQLQNADNQAENARLAENAEIISERNDALGRNALVDKLRRQTGVDP